MGDVGQAPLEVHSPQPASPEEITVLVTGFGPFKSFTHNPSYLVATSLPTLLLPVLSPNPPDSETSTPPPHPPIRLIIHPTPIRVSYSNIHTLVPALLASYPNVDFVLHIGMAGGRSYYTLETLAHRDGYVIRDVDGGDGSRAEKEWRALGAPGVLRPDSDWVDCEDVQRRWKASMALGRTGYTQDPDVRLSDDAGHFACDFIFYTSLVERWKTGQEGKVLFLHTPGAADAASVERGVRVATGLIRSVVECCEETKGLRAKETFSAAGEVGKNKVAVAYVA